jgi:hypothetical protein
MSLNPKFASEWDAWTCELRDRDARCRLTANRSEGTADEGTPEGA